MASWSSSLAPFGLGGRLQPPATASASTASWAVRTAGASSACVREVRCQFNIGKSPVEGDPGLGDGHPAGLDEALLVQPPGGHLDAVEVPTQRHVEAGLVDGPGAEQALCAGLARVGRRRREPDAAALPAGRDQAGEAAVEVDVVPLSELEVERQVPHGPVSAEGREERPVGQQVEELVPGGSSVACGHGASSR